MGAGRQALCEMTVEISRLRDRQGDRILLARHFMLKCAKEHSRNISGFTPGAVSNIESCSWPGDIREMKYKIKRAVIMADGKHLTCEDPGLEPGDQRSLSLQEVSQEAEMNAILRALAMTDNNVSTAARLLGITRPMGITRPTFHDLIK